MLNDNENNHQIDFIKNGSIYEHYKGKQYKVLSIARHTNDLSWMVVYECLYDNPHGSVWVRPLNEFIGTVIQEKSSIPRFRYIGQE